MATAKNQKQATTGSKQAPMKTPQAGKNSNKPRVKEEIKKGSNKQK